MVLDNEIRRSANRQQTDLLQTHRKYFKEILYNKTQLISDDQPQQLLTQTLYLSQSLSIPLTTPSL